MFIRYQCQHSLAAYLHSGMQQGVDLNNLDCWPAPDSPSDRFLLMLMVKLILKQEIHCGAIWFPAAHCIIIRLLQRLMFLLIQGVSHFQYKKKLKQDLDSHPPINLSLPPILLHQPSNLVHYMTRQYSPASSWHVPEFILSFLPMVIMVQTLVSLITVEQTANAKLLHRTIARVWYAGQFDPLSWSVHPTCIVVCVVSWASFQTSIHWCLTLFYPQLCKSVLQDEH